MRTLPGVVLRFRLADIACNSFMVNEASSAGLGLPVEVREGRKPG